MGHGLSDPVALVADAFEASGLGHLSRTGAVAVGLRSRGIPVRCFALGALRPIRRDGLEWEPREDTAALEELPCSALVLDSYQLDPAHASRLGAARPLIAFHDDGEPVYGAALIVSPAGDSRPGPARWLTGFAHACMRPMFWGLPRRTVNPEVRRVLVSTGAADVEGHGVALARAAARAAPTASVRLVQGPHGSVAKAEAGVEVVSAPPQLLDELLAADAVITAGGQTMLEAAAAGTPTVAVVVADNQRPVARKLADVGAIRLAHNGSATVEEELASLAASADLRARLSAVAQQTIDGLGALRVAFQIAQLASVV